ncbi:hypothetical protein [Mycobacterium sp. URHB0021]|jgi:hypothetical protein
MFADTDAIRAFGAANRSQAADLAAIAARLSLLPAAGSASALGPVGALFLSALAAAVSGESLAVTALSDRVASTSTTAHATAVAYDEADGRAGAAISGA